jgi:ParB family chromosome partitioning protein
MTTPNWFTRMVAIKDVKPPLHPRTFKAEGIAALAESIAATGLDHPILIDEDDRLLAGQRRLAACKSLGWSTVPAKVVKLEGAAAELATLDENLMREDYIEAERLLALAHRKELYEALHPAAKQGGLPGKAGGGKAKTADSASFVTDTAEKTGKAASTVAHDQTIADNLDPKAATTLVGTPSGDSKAELSALSKLPPAEQRRVASAVKSGKAKSVRTAKPPAAPKSGAQKKDPRLWGEIEGLLGKALNRTDELNRQFPHGNLHRKLIGEIKTPMATLKEWKQAART